MAAANEPPVGDATPDSPDRHDLAHELAANRPPADSPERDRVDAAIRRAKELCQPTHDRGDYPYLPCADCIRQADAEMQPPTTGTP